MSAEEDDEFMNDLTNYQITTVFAEHPLASSGSAKLVSGSNLSPFRLVTFLINLEEYHNLFNYLAKYSQFCSSHSPSYTKSVN